MNPAGDAAAVITAINAQFTSPRAIRMKDAAAQTADHIIVFVSRRHMDGHLMSGEARVEGGRIITRYVARAEDNIDVLRQRTKAAIEEKFLPGGVGPFAFETEHEDLRFDTEAGGWYVTADSWTY